MLKAIIFDLDGVLINSEPQMRHAFEVSYRSVVGDGPPPIEAYLEHMGEAFPQIMDKLKLPHAMWQPYVQYCQQHIDQIALFPQSYEILDWASDQGLSLAILTGKDHARTLQILQHLGLLHYFHAVVSSDQLRKPKPDPEGILHILDILDTSVEDTVMIGDSVSDIICAQSAGMRNIAVSWGTKPENLRNRCSPDVIVNNGQELIDALWQLKRENDRQTVSYFSEERSHGC